VQDFEGQRLAEMLTTVLLGAAGVRLLPLAYVAALTPPDHRLLRRLLHTGHPPVALCRPRRHRPHLPRRRSAVALLQQKPRGLAASKQRVARVQHRCGWPEGGLERNMHGSKIDSVTWRGPGGLHECISYSSRKCTVML
jgi:hypothetical protein